MKGLLIAALVFALAVGGSVLAFGQAGDMNKDLLDAAKFGNIQRAKECLDKGANVNGAEKDTGLTPLIAAVISGNVEVVKLLLDKGANVNAKSTGGVTALMAASLDANKIEIAKMLLEKGAEVNATTGAGLTALKYSGLTDEAKGEGQQKMSSMGLQPKGSAIGEKPANPMQDLLKKYGAQ